MLTIIKIASNSNGSHCNQTIDQAISVPQGWAVIPESLGTPEALKNFPFGEVYVEDRDGIPVVINWVPLPMPDPAPEPEPAPTLERRVDALEAETAAISAAIERGLSL